MALYDVIATYRDRDTGRYVEPGDMVDLDSETAERLERAQCVRQSASALNGSPQRQPKKRRSHTPKASE